MHGKEYKHNFPISGKKGTFNEVIYTETAIKSIGIDHTENEARLMYQGIK